MTPIYLRPDAVFDGYTLRGDVTLQIAGGIVRPIASSPQDSQWISGIVAAGFVDLQVNGGGGVLLNATPTVGGLRRIAAAHRGFGTVALLPTVITDAPEVLAAAADAVIANAGADGILGLHIEGPHIAAAKRGTHAARHIRPMDELTLDIVARLRAAGHTVIITVAPEACPSEGIAALASMGAVVSIGHSDSDAATVANALSAGASCGTHLFNAMSQMTARDAGVAGGLLHGGAYAGIICDGHHVADQMIALALRAQKIPDRLFLVSDAMPTVGGPDRFTLYGDEIRLEAGRLVNAEGRLAGAHLTQAAGLARLVDKIGVDTASALQMVTTIPAKVIDRPDLARIEGRSPADLVLLDTNMAARPLTDAL